MLETLGYVKDDIENADDSNANIYIINTCSVRENADNRFFGTLGRLKIKKAKNREVIVATCGCMMQQQTVVDTVKKKAPWVDLIFGTHNIDQLPTLLANVVNEKKKIISVIEDTEQIVEGLPVKRLYDFKALVSIMQGCNNFCTYCIVPYTRGREKSRPPEVIINEVRELVASGTKEITLLGQNVNSYGKGCDFNMDFADLVHELNKIEGLARLRFMTSHPKDISDKLIDCFRTCDVLRNYIHLPVQSGSNAVLKRMNRGYQREEYLESIIKLREASPDIGITTDIIVGFPGESEEDFEETLDLVRKADFDSAFMFLYSVRQGTPAEKYEDQIPEEVKHQRFNRLVELVNGNMAKKNKACVDKTYPVLVEGPSKNNEATYTGRTPESKVVNFSPNETNLQSMDIIGKIVNIKIKEAKTFSLNGEIQA